MKKLILTAALGALSLGLAACGDRGTENGASAENAAGAENGSAAGGSEAGSAGNAAGGDWAAGTRIVEENGVTFRVSPDGTRVQLGENEGRIVVENGVRYRVSNGNRVRIDERGVDIDLDGPDLPGVDVDVGTNRKGNLDVDVNTNGSDATPNR